MPKKAAPVGTCRLTGLNGSYVRSHIIPRFLADKALGKAHRIQFGEGSRPALVFNSWVDRELCVAQGEARLRDIDTAAAQVFRKHGLSWRHFPLSAAAVKQPLGAFDAELITLPDVDTKTLRLFFLSVLWRSAASSRFELAEIFLDQGTLERLRQIVAGEIEPDDDDFPCVLVLLTEQGQPQVHSPLAQTIDMKHLGFDFPSVPIFRFFFDGLIAHVGRKSQDSDLLDKWGARAVGGSSNLIMIGRPYEGSSQERNLNLLQNTLHREHREEAVRIYRTLQEIDLKDIDPDD